MANSLITAGADNSPRSQPQEDKVAEEKKPDRRVVMYREGESKEFSSPDDVPKGEGWVDNPDKVKPHSKHDKHHKKDD